MGPASFALSPRSITSVKRLVMSKYEVTFANRIGLRHWSGRKCYQWFVADGAIEEQQAITAIKEVQSCQAEATTTK